MQKKFFFITPQLYPNFVGGAEVFNYYLIGRLTSISQVTYITQCSTDIIGAKKIKLRSRKNFIQLIEIFIRILKSSKNETFVVSFMKTRWIYIIMYPILSFLLGKKYIIIIHGGGMMQWKWKWPYKFFFNQAKTIFGVSMLICNEYCKRTGIDINYLPPLIPFEIAKQDKSAIRKAFFYSDDEKIFLVVGSLKILKKPFVILEALKSINRTFLRNKKVRFLFLGDGPLRIQMNEFIKLNNLTDFVKLLGNVERDKINAYYKISDYYIISSDFEGTPISMLEAMYNKLLIIGSNVTGINNIINSENGYLFDNSNPFELKEILHDVIDNDNKEKRDSAFNFYVNHFNYDAVIEKLYSKT